MAMENCLCTLETQPFILERTWDAEGIEVLRVRAAVPDPTGDSRICRRIRRFYRSLQRSFLRYCETCLFPLARAEYEASRAVSAPPRCFTAELSYCITYNENGFWSLWTLAREDTGRPFLSRRGDTWDLSEGYPVPMSRFFRKHTLSKRLLLRFAAAELERRERAGHQIRCADWHRRMRRSLNTRNYYLTPEGLTYFLPMRQA